MSALPPPIEVFLSYADPDETLCIELEKHLSQLYGNGLLTVWQKRQIVGGQDLKSVLDQHLSTASIILLLISSDFLASNDCVSVQMKRALERNAQNEAHVIPIILRPCDWQAAPFAHLHILPHDGRAVTEWANQDAAFRDVARGVRAALGPLRAISPQSQLVSVVTGTPPAIASRRALLPRVTSIEQQNREHLIRRVRSFWIKGVFEKSLYGAALMMLGLQESPEAVINPWHLVVQESEHVGTPLSADTPITEVYDSSGGELLILGEPGSGKTTLLLELAHDLLDRTEQEPTHPIPVVFNLSSWMQKRQPLADWLIEELVTKYQVPRKVGSDWVNADQILPLLDGLDEVDAPPRAACMQAISAYHQAHHLVPLVVCCRVDEYMSQGNRLALSYAVTIQRLSIEQVNAYLTRIGERVASLRIALQHDPALQELATTPLMLTILILAYQGSSLEEFRRDVSTEGRLPQILETYVLRMFERRSAKLRYSPQQTIHWLCVLAQQMKQQSETVFYIERMQPNWLMRKWQRQWYYGLTVGPVCGLFVGLGILGTPLLPFPFIVLIAAFTLGLLFGWASEPETARKGTKAITCTWMCLRQSLAIVLENAVMMGGFAGFLAGISSLPYEYLVDFSHEPFGIRIAFALNSSLYNALYLGLIFGLAVRLERRIKPLEALSWSWAAIQGNVAKWLLIGIGTGLLLGLIGALPFMISRQGIWLEAFLQRGWFAGFYLVVLMLVNGVVGGLSKRVLDSQHIVTPNQGIWRSARYGVIMALITGGIAAVFSGANEFITYFWFPSQPTVTDFSIVSAMSHLLGFYPKTSQEFWALDAVFFGLRDGTILGLAAGLYCGGAAYVQHFVLRFLLWRTRSVPFNYPRFLDYAASRILLRKVGGGYIFIHRLLLEYFASLEENRTPSESGV